MTMLSKLHYAWLGSDSLYRLPEDTIYKHYRVVTVYLLVRLCLAI